MRADLIYLGAADFPGPVLSPSSWTREVGPILKGDGVARTWLRTLRQVFLATRMVDMPDATVITEPIRRLSSSTDERLLRHSENGRHPRPDAQICALDDAGDGEHDEAARASAAIAGAPRAGNAAEIVVDAKFARLVPLAPEEQALTVDRLLHEGCREPLVVWRRLGRLVLLVGYDRLPTLKRYHIPFSVIEKEFPVREQARLFIIKHHLARPNLTSLEITYLHGLRYWDEKKGAGGDRRSPAARLAKKTGKTAEALAPVLGESAATIRRAGALVAAVRRILAECGTDVMPLLFSRKAKLSRQTVLALSRLERPRLRTLLRRLRTDGKLPRSWRGTPSTTITLPREPRAMARALQHRMGRSWLIEFADAIRELSGK
jgi:hypothetical protein